MTDKIKHIRLFLALLKTSIRKEKSMLDQQLRVISELSVVIYASLLVIFLVLMARRKLPKSKFCRRFTEYVGNTDLGS